MKSFLEKVTDDLLPIESRKLLVIFPTQRACREFKRIYAAKTARVSTLPAVIPISELLEQFDTPVVADDLTILLELKKVYDALYTPEKIESFLSFGQQLLDDFNEIDRQMIPTEYLFQEVRDMKELDERFTPGAEEADYIRSFWKEFLTTPYTPLQASFLQYWKQLPAIYSGLRSRLEEKNIAYEGMAWRKAAGSISKQAFFEQFDQVAFAGFYALNTTEEVILNYLKSKNKLLLFADADPLYCDNSTHEAGMFFRRGFFANQPFAGKEEYFSIPKTSYSVKGCAGRFSIARELALSLQNDIAIEASNGVKKSRIIVLADETLLYPFLHQSALLGINLNPSMGFPLKHHPVYRLLQVIKTCRKYPSDELTEVLITRYTQEFTADPLVQAITFNSEQSDTLLSEQLVLFIRELLFPKDRSPEAEAGRLFDFIKKISFEKEQWMYDVHVHCIHALETGIKLIRQHQDELPNSTWWELLLEHLSRQRVPFLADRETGVPVVGFLESRILDFDAVYIAPLNEGTLPSHAVSKSLIPYSLRKAYHLPCKEEQDAVTAYHFYRLLQRAADIQFFYNTDLNATGGGERSRYLFQIQKDILEKNPPAMIKYEQQEAFIQPDSTTTISIAKSDAVLGKLRAKFDGSIKESGRAGGFSASAINTYILCPLKFYFDQIAGIRPDQEVPGLTGGNFGNVLHKSMETAYLNGGLIQKDDVLLLHARVAEIVESAVKSEYELPASSGHDYLMKGVITELVKRIFKFDESHTPFEIMGLEEELIVRFNSEKSGPFAIKGIIDRLDIYDDAIRVLDYKTGNDKITQELEPDVIFTDPEHKLNLQLILYVLLVSEYYPDLQYPVKAGIFRMRQFDEEVAWLNDGYPLENSYLEKFKSRLIELVDDIFNASKSFDQTKDPENCRFCDYRQLCGRTQ